MVMVMVMAMAGVASTCFGVKPITSRPLIECSMPSSRTNTIKVIINGAGKDIGRAAIAAVSKARGMELAGAIDPLLVGRDAGEIANLDEPLEIPVLNDLVMLLASLSQSRTAGVLMDFSEPSSVYDNVRQATAFGMRSVVHVPGVSVDVIASLSQFCEKASMGCIIAPTLSIGSLLLEKAAMTAAYHYNHVEIVESRPDTSVCPSPDTIQLANNLSGLGQTYNKNDLSTGFVMFLMDLASLNPMGRMIWQPLQHCSIMPRRSLSTYKQGVKLLGMVYVSIVWLCQGFTQARKYTSLHPERFCP